MIKRIDNNDQSKGYGKKGQQWNDNNSTGKGWNQGYPRMEEILLTEVGRWHRNLTESIKLSMDYPRGTALATGEAGAAILPKTAIERLGLIIPYLQLNANNETFNAFAMRLKDYAEKSGTVANDEALWAAAGFTLPKPRLITTKIKMRQMRNDMSQMMQAQAQALNAIANQNNAPSASLVHGAPSAGPALFMTPVAHRLDFNATPGHDDALRAALGTPLTLDDVDLGLPGGSKSSLGKTPDKKTLYTRRSS